MPLVAIALLSYGAGLIAGLSGALGGAASVAAGIALVAAARRSGPLAAIALLGAAGLGMGRAVERGDHACAVRVASRSEWTIVPANDLAPGETGDVLVREGRCAMRAWASVVSGRAAAGATATVRGVPRLDRRGLSLGTLRVVTSLSVVTESQRLIAK